MLIYSPVRAITTVAIRSGTLLPAASKVKPDTESGMDKVKPVKAKGGK